MTVLRVVRGNLTRNVPSDKCYQNNIPLPDVNSARGKVRAVPKQQPARSLSRERERRCF